jgi:mitochondrial distribution and morphology protein 10
MMGHISGAYAARVSRDLALSSRFEFNIYSYESEWTMGAEWWMRSSPRKDTAEERKDDSAIPLSTISSDFMESKHVEDVHGVVKARASTTNVSITYRLLHHSFIILVECVTDVGRTAEKYAGQLRRCLRLFEPFEAHKSHWT